MDRSGAKTGAKNNDSLFILTSKAQEAGGRRAIVKIKRLSLFLAPVFVPALIYLPLMMLAGGFISVFLGKELSWDLANYHFYNPFAYLNGRDQYDFWPSSFIHQYINPTIDFISYYLITRVSPWTAEFILGAIHAINAWLLFLIAKEFLPDHRQEWIAIFLALLGMFGPTVLPGIGSFMNDNFVSLFVLGFVLLQIKSLRQFHPRLQIASGFLLGIGFGLKLTTGIFLAGGIFATLILPVSYAQRLRMLFYWGSAAAVAYLLTSGYWMHLQWIKYHNPVFPFFNEFFHSNEFTYTNWSDVRFLPHGILHHLFFPFYFSFNGMLTGNRYKDCRILLAFILFFIAGCQWLWQRSTGQSVTSDSRRYWLYAFVISSYWIWQEFFATARYFGVGEMLAPLVIYLLVQQIVVEKTRRLVLLGIIFSMIVFMMSPARMVRVNWYQHSFFNVSLPASVNAYPAHVLIGYSAYIVGQRDPNKIKASEPAPLNYLIPFFPQSWHFTGMPFSYGKYLEDTRTTQKIKERLMNMDGPVYLLSDDYTMPAFYRIAARFGLQPNGRCSEITSDRQAMTKSKILLCPVKRQKIVRR